MEFDFSWHKEYSIGVDEIDSQHKRLLELMGHVYELGKVGNSHPLLEAVLGELSRYALFHFRSEELLMRTYSYPGYIEQRKEHDKLLARLGELLPEVSSGSRKIGSFLLFLVNWFVDHDNYLDKDFGSYVVSARRRLVNRPVQQTTAAMDC